jgi:peptidoglycan/LPS O-acetylase OafA/YrhL
MAEILVGAAMAVALVALFQFWRRRRKDKARSAEALSVGLLAAVGGVFLICLVVFIIPAIPAYDWGDIVLVVIKLGIVMVGAGLTLGGAGLAIASIGKMRTPEQ